jgi:hypothetical protein
MHEVGYATGRVNTMTEPAVKLPGVHAETERLAQFIEENQMLTARLRERLGAVCRPQPQVPGMCGEGLKTPAQSPVAETLSGLGSRLSNNNREIEALLELIDL